MPLIATPMVTAQEAKDFLNITVTTYDAELTNFIAAASQIIYNKIGVVSGSPTVEEWHDGGSERLVLRNQGPIQSVATVTESYGSISYTLTQVVLDSGSVSTAYGYSVDLDHGVIVRRASGVAVPFAAGVRNVHVTYVAGYVTTPPDIKHGCLLLTQHLWQTQRGTTVRPGGEPTPNATFTLPRRVEEILAPYMVPGIA